MEEGLKQYVIRPIIRNKFSGQSYYNKTQTIIQGAQLSMNGVYKTGLSVTEEAYYEKELNLPKGTLNKRNAEFWGDMEVRLRNDKLTIFNMVTLYDELKFKMLQEHDRIARTEHDVVGNSTAQFYIYDPEAAAKIENEKLELENEAMELFFKTTVEERRGLLRVYGKRGVDSMSETMVKTELSKQVKVDYSEFIRLMNSKDTPTRALLETLIEKDIIKKKGTYFYNGEDLLGNSTDEMVGYLQNPKNQAIRLSLESKLKPKKQKVD